MTAAWRYLGRFVSVLAIAVLAGVAVPTARAGSLPPVIAFNDAGGIWTVQPGVPSTERLFVPDPSDGSGSVAFPTWSPNGAELAYQLRDSTTNRDKILLADRTGKLIGTALSLPESLSKYFTGPFAWSPDGKQIAYWCSHQTGTNQFGIEIYQTDVCVVDMASGAHRVLAASTSAIFVEKSSGGPYQMYWSRNGKEIVLDVSHVVTCAPPVTGLCSQSDIGLVDVATGTLRLLTTGGGISPAFSPNGSEIVYFQYQAAGSTPAGVDIMSASGSFIREVVPSSEIGNVFAEPSWSPNGKEILFGSAQAPANNFNIDLFIVSVNGGRHTQTTNTPGDSVYPNWGPALTLCTVPKLKGHTLAAAKKLLKRAGCALGSVGGRKKNRGSLHVTKQSPGPNRNVPAGTKVKVRLG